MGTRNYVIFDYLMNDNVLDDESDLIQKGAIKLEPKVDLIEIISKLLKDITEERRRNLRINTILSILSIFVQDYLKSEDLIRGILEFINNEEAERRLENLLFTYIEEPEDIENIRESINKVAGKKHLYSTLDSFEPVDTIHDYLSQIILHKLIDISLLNQKNTEIIYKLSRTNYWKICGIKQPVLLLKEQYIVSNIDGIETYIYIYSNNDKDNSFGKSSILYSSNTEALVNKCTKEENIIIDATNKKLSRVKEYEQYMKNKRYPLDNYDIDYKSININRDRTGILLYGPPGTGKTCWCYSFYHQILREEGYVLIVLNYQNYKDMNLYISGLKCCLLINDADYLEKEKESRAIILSKLEAEYGKNVITLLTVNGIYFDDALMRKGRIDYRFDLSRTFV